MTNHLLHRFTSIRVASFGSEGDGSIFASSYDLSRTLLHCSVLSRQEETGDDLLVPQALLDSRYRDAYLNT